MDPAVGEVVVVVVDGNKKDRKEKCVFVLLELVANVTGEMFTM